jgi:hypothetical protein
LDEEAHEWQQQPINDPVSEEVDQALMAAAKRWRQTLAPCRQSKGQFSVFQDLSV